MVDILQKIAFICGEQSLWAACKTDAELLDAARKYHGTLDESTLEVAGLPARYWKRILLGDELFHPDCSVSRMSPGLLASVLVAPSGYHIRPGKATLRRRIPFLNEQI